MLSEGARNAPRLAASATPVVVRKRRVGRVGLMEVPRWGALVLMGVSFLLSLRLGVRGQVFNGWGSRGLWCECHNTVDRHADGQVIEGPHEVISVVKFQGTVSLAAGRIEEEPVAPVGVID